MKKMKRKVCMLTMLIAFLGMNACVMALTIAWPQQDAKFWGAPDAIWQTAPGVSSPVPPGSADYAYIMSTNEVTVNTDVLIKRLYIDRALTGFPTAASKVTVVPSGKLAVTSIAQFGVDIGGGTLNVTGGEVAFATADTARANTWSVRLDAGGAANVNITAGKVTVGSVTVANTQVLSQAGSSTVISISGTGLMEMLNGAKFVLDAGNSLVQLSDGGLLKYTGVNATADVSVLANAGKLKGILPLSPAPYAPSGTSNGVGWYYDGANTYVFAIAGPSVDIGGNQLVWLATAAAGLQMNSQILNYDPAETYSYSWSGSGVTFDNGSGGDGSHLPNPIAIFSSAGVYSLTLQVTNSLGIGVDEITVTVLDPAVSNKQIAHWAMNEGAGTSVADSSVDGYNNAGKIAGTVDWRSGWVGSNSLYFNGSTTVNVTPDTIVDPNVCLNKTPYGISLAAWMKADVAGLTQYILEKTDSYNLRLLSTGGIRARFYGTSDQYLDFTEQRFDNGNWYHVTATYDAVKQEANLYINGLKVVSQPSSGLLTGSDPNLILGGAWQGGLDDVYVYSYALDESQVQVLAGLGDIVPLVKAGTDQVYQINPSFPLVMQGSVFDLDSTPTIQWSVSSGNAASVTFVNASSPTTAVSFNPADPGVFTLRLSATDTVGGQQVVIYDEVVITANAPTCTDVVAAGLVLPLDFSGPIEGQPDCYINLYDFAYFAKSWLECNDPVNPACDWPWQ